MQDHRTQLASLIASRICHDLISPVGAISNGLELVSLSSGRMDGPEMSLIEDSCRSANARIKFFRVAFGLASDGASISATEIRGIIDQMMDGSRISVRWETDVDVARNEVQLAFLGMLCLESAMRRGGTLRITVASDIITLVAEAERLAPEPAMWAHLDAPTSGRVMGEAIDLPPSQVQFAMLPILATSAGRRPHYSLGDGHMTLTI